MVAEPAGAAPSRPLLHSSEVPPPPKMQHLSDSNTCDLVWNIAMKSEGSGGKSRRREEITKELEREKGRDEQTGR